jgi:hypothetical protein
MSLSGETPDFLLLVLSIITRTFPALRWNFSYGLSRGRRRRESAGARPISDYCLKASDVANTWISSTTLELLWLPSLSYSQQCFTYWARPTLYEFLLLTAFNATITPVTR